MSLPRQPARVRSISIGRTLQPRLNPNDSDIDVSPRNEQFPNVSAELTKIIRKLLPQEIPLNIHVRNVDYRENGCEPLNGTLYMTTFRLVFAPDNEITNSNYVVSDVAPVESRSGFRSFLNESQIQSETRAFTIITRDFRNINFSKCSIIKSNSIESKPTLSSTKMEIYINAIRCHSRFQSKEQLYPYYTIQKPSKHNLTPKLQQGYPLSLLLMSSTFGGRSIDDETADFCISDDERIRSFMTMQDWEDELNDAKEKQWITDQTQFTGQYFARRYGIGLTPL